MANMVILKLVSFVEECIIAVSSITIEEIRP